MRLIDADVLVKRIQYLLLLGHRDAFDCLDEIDAAPTIEVEPIRHGRPKYIFTQPRSMISDCKVVCKECGYTKSRVDGEIIKYCQYCGVKLDGEIRGIAWEG